MDQQIYQRMLDHACHKIHIELSELMEKYGPASVVDVSYAPHRNAMMMDHAAAGPLSRDSGYESEGANHLPTSYGKPTTDLNSMNTQGDAPHSYHAPAPISSSNSNSHEDAPHSHRASAPVSSSNSSDDSLPSTMSAAVGGVSKATQLKRSFIAASGHTVSGRKLTGEHDPENREIKRLRQEQDLGFDDIANELNQKRVSVGAAPDLTANAVYSRYKRNAPLIAAMDGEDFRPTALDKKHTSIKFKKAPTITGFDAYEDELLVKAHNKIQEDMWLLVSDRIMAMGGKYHDPTMCAGRFKCL